MADEIVPTLHLSEVEADPQLVDDACRDHGVFHLEGHGISDECFREMRAATRAFFSLPLQAKRAVSRSAHNAWGFCDHELTKNTPDWKQVYDVGPPETVGANAGAAPQWPAELPGFETTIGRWHAACERVALRLLRCIERGLGVESGSMLRAFEPEHSSFIRLNYYPRCGRPESPDAISTPTRGHLGVNHHTDAGALTLLLQDDQPGMQVHGGGRWHTIGAPANSVVVNIGDVLQVWSNDRYPSALHRVLANAHAERYSVPFFFNPSYSTIYAPLPRAGAPDERARFGPISWDEFRSLRAAGDYADLGEEVQIDRYRV